MIGDMTDEEIRQGLIKATDQVIMEILRNLTMKDFHKSFDVGGTTFDAYWYTYPPVDKGLIALRELPEGVIEVVMFAKNETELIKRLQTERQ